jgi:hypothetical protein
MKLTQKVGILVSMLVIAVGATAPTSLGVDIPVQGKYVWRGFCYNPEPVLWPDIWMAWDGLKITAFGSLDITDKNGYRGEIVEFDFILDYSHSFKYVALSIGYSHYTFPNTGDPYTGELYSTVGTNFECANIALKAYYDILDAGGLYISPEISASYSLGLFEPSLTLSLGYGSKKHNSRWAKHEKSCMTDFTGVFGLVFNLPGKLGEYLSISGDLDYAVLINEDLADDFKEDTGFKDKNFFWGIGINYSFSFVKDTE